MTTNPTTIPSCSIIIRSYNEEQHIGRLLVGIMEQTIKNIEIILVDSGSTDSTVSLASHFPVKIVHIEPGEFSFGRALNRGCEVATGDILINASAHIYPVYRDWLANMVKPFVDSEVALVYGRQKGGETTKYSEHQVFAQWFPNQSSPRQTHPFCNNANAAIRRVLWEDQPWDEELTGLEDLDWATKILKRGYYLAYAADAVIIHAHDETNKSVFNRYLREALAHKRIIPEQHFSLWDFVHLTVSNIFHDYYHAIRDGLFLKNIRAIPIFRTIQHWGAYRGFNRRSAIPRQLKESFYYPRGLARVKEDSREDVESVSIAYDQTIGNYLDG